MTEGFVHPLVGDGAWANATGDDQPLPGTFETEEAAVIVGRDEAVGPETERVIHDPYDTTGKRASSVVDPDLPTRPIEAGRVSPERGAS